MKLSIKPIAGLIMAVFTVAAVASCGKTPSTDSKTSYQAAAKNLSGVVKWQEITPGSAEYHFLMGGYETLAAVEYILQVRYNNYSGELPLVPGGSMRFESNPDVKFDPAFVETALTGALDHLAKAEASLKLAAGKDFAINVNIGELWLDINSNGTRDEGEDVLTALKQMPQFRGANMQGLTVRFDTADADWLAAYVHMLSGTAELILSVDPTLAIKTVTEGRALLEEKGRIANAPFIEEDEMVDTWSIILIALRGEPDKVRTRAALSHFRAMIDHNKSFWKLVMEETDDDAEWLPNPNQKSAFGPEVSLEMAESWQAVLGDISDVLEGKTLLRHWRIGQRGADTSLGINFAKLLEDPQDFDIILLLQGTAIAPYVERGPIADMSSFREFSRMTGGQGGLFALWFN